MSVDVNYYCFSPNLADDGWKNFEKDFSAIKKAKSAKNNEGELDIHQKSLLEDSYAGDIFYLERPDNYDIQYGLKSIDLYYGASRNDYFESPKSESAILENIVKYFQLETEGEIPKKEEWIKAFERIKTDDIISIAKMLSESIGWEKEEAQDELISYLKSVKPVISDLKKVKDSIFVRWYGGSLKVEPPSSELLLSERVEEHINKYKEILQS